MRTKTILFITGAFVSNAVWNNWKTYFEEKGYTTHAPAWPHKDAPAKVLRNRHPDAGIASLRLNDLVKYYANIIDNLPEQPVLIGHSLGGLIVQLLLQQKRGVAGVAIHPVPPQGVMTLKWSFYRAATPPLGLFTSAKKTYMMTFSQWQYAFTNGMTLQEQKDGYDDFALPESKLLLRDGLTSAAAINFKNPHAPLLFISGGADHIMPASLNFSNFKRYKDKNSITEYMEFEHSNHFVLGQPTWKNEANFIACWLEKNA